MALAEQRRWGGTLGRTLVEMKLISEAELVRVLSQQLEPAERSISTTLEIPPTVLELVPGELAEQHSIVPFAQPMKFLDVAMAEPTNLGVIDELRIRTQLNIRPYLAGPKMIERATREALPPRVRPHAPSRRDAVALDTATSIAEARRDDRPSADEIDGRPPPRRPAPAARTARRLATAADRRARRRSSDPPLAECAPRRRDRRAAGSHLEARGPRRARRGGAAQAARAARREGRRDARRDPRADSLIRRRWPRRGCRACRRTAAGRLRARAPCRCKAIGYVGDGAIGSAPVVDEADLLGRTSRVLLSCRACQARAIATVDGTRTCHRCRPRPRCRGTELIRERTPRGITSLALAVAVPQPSWSRTQPTRVDVPHSTTSDQSSSVASAAALTAVFDGVLAGASAGIRISIFARDHSTTARRARARRAARVRRRRRDRSRSMRARGFCGIEREALGLDRLPSRTSEPRARHRRSITPRCDASTAPSSIALGEASAAAR